MSDVTVKTTNLYRAIVSPNKKSLEEATKQKQQKENEKKKEGVTLQPLGTTRKGEALRKKNEQNKEAEQQNETIAVTQDDDGPIMSDITKVEAKKSETRQEAEEEIITENKSTTEEIEANNNKDQVGKEKQQKEKESKMDNGTDDKDSNV